MRSSSFPVRPAVAALTALAGACASQPTELPVDEVHNVVALLPMTGAFSGKGPEHLQSIQKGFADLEAGGGLDKPIRVHVVDIPDNDSAIASGRLVEIVDELTVGGNRYVAAIISSTTAALKSAAPVALAEGIPHFEISSGSGLDEVTLDMSHDRTFAFNPRPLCMPEPVVTSSFLAARAASPGWGRVFVMRGSQVHDKMHTRELREGMLAEGEASRLINATDLEMANTGPFETYIDMAMAAGAEVLYWHLNGDSNNLAFMQAAERRGFTGKLVTCGMARNVTLLHPTDPGISPYLSASGATGEGRLFFAMRGPVTGEGLTRFKSDFLTFSGKSSDPFSPAGYDSAVLIGLGLLETGGAYGLPLRDAISSVSTEGQPFAYGQVGAAMTALRAGQDIDYDGASGSLDLRFDMTLGNIAVGRYYMETVVKPSSAYEYKELTAPVEIRDL